MRFKVFYYTATIVSEQILEKAWMTWVSSSTFLYSQFTFVPIPIPLNDNTVSSSTFLYSHYNLVLIRNSTFLYSHYTLVIIPIPKFPLHPCPYPHFYTPTTLLSLSPFLTPTMPLSLSSPFLYSHYSVLILIPHFYTPTTLLPLSPFLYSHYTLVLIPPIPILVFIHVYYLHYIVYPP